jgi:hypothetical protein
LDLRKAVAFRSLSQRGGLPFYGFIAMDLNGPINVQEFQDRAANTVDDLLSLQGPNGASAVDRILIEVRKLVEARKSGDLPGAVASSALITVFLSSVLHDCGFELERAMAMGLWAIEHEIAYLNRHEPKG